MNSADSTSSDNLLVEADHGLAILSQLPTFDTTWVWNEERSDLAVLIHQHYRAFQSPASLPDPEWTWKKATIEIVAVRKAFPAIKEAEDTILAMTAWFHFLCNFDDEIEQMDSLGRARILERIIEALKAASSEQLRPTKRTTIARRVMDIFKIVNIGLGHKVSLTTHERTVNNLTEIDHAKVLALATNFIRQCQVVLSLQALPKVFAEVISYLEALKKESAYRESTTLSSVEDYLQLRMGTIGLSPFFAILEATLVGIETPKYKDVKIGNNNNNNTKDLRHDGSTTSGNNDSSSFWTSPLHKRLCDGIKCVVGLQNDIVGLNRDIENGDRLNLAVLLLEQRNETTDNIHAINKARDEAVLIHNKEMKDVLRNWTVIQAANYSPAVQVYTQSLVALTRTFFTWATHTDRYKSKHKTVLEIVSIAGQNAAVEGLRFKARVIRTRRSLQQLVGNHTK